MNWRGNGVIGPILAMMDELELVHKNTPNRGDTMAWHHANRGMGFQKTVLYTCEQYSAKGWAEIQEVATPWNVVRSGKQIISAYPEKQSTVDFVGVWNGRAVAFDAKETKERTRFPLKNVEEHQVQFLRRFMDQGGITFLLIEFAALRETYAVPFAAFEKWWISAQHGGRQSVPHSEFWLGFDQVKSGRGIALDFLPVLESWQRAGEGAAGP